jgi:hypothetical protein
MRRPFTFALILLTLAVALSGWLLAAESAGAAPAGVYKPAPFREVKLTGPDAAARRRELLRRASPRHLEPDTDALLPAPSLPDGHPLTGDLPACRFLVSAPSGTSAKFDCVFDGGEVVKVKYGRNPEIHAEAAATALLTRLGYAADAVHIVPRLRCYGCPRFPFTTMKLLTYTLGEGLMSPHGYARGYTDFDWVSVERKWPAAAIETDSQEGWAWWELNDSTAPPDEIDAFRLLAVFLGHWDNKSDNQRLVCMDADAGPACARPVLMMTDVGATFGPTKLNRARWHDLPVWADSRACAASMRALPFHGGTFPDTRISEAGRALLARRLSQLSDADVRRIFAEARVPQFQSATDDEQDLRAWVNAFRHRLAQIVDAGPCAAERSTLPFAPDSPRIH